MYVDYSLAIKYTYSIELLRKVVERFLDEYQSFDLKLLEYSKEEVLDSVHKIKGITLNLGARKLYEDCIELEESNNYDETLKSFIYTFNKTYKELFKFQSVN